MIVIMIPTTTAARTHWAKSEHADETLCGIRREETWGHFLDPLTDPAARPTCLVCLEAAP